MTLAGVTVERNTLLVAAGMARPAKKKFDAEKVARQAKPFIFTAVHKEKQVSLK